MPSPGKWSIVGAKEKTLGRLHAAVGPLTSFLVNPHSRVNRGHSPVTDGQIFDLQKPIPVTIR